jgi:hypothetical protein
MPHRRFNDLPSPVPIVLPTSSVLPKTHDEHLLHRATARWRESSMGLRALFAGIPPVRDSLERLLKRRLDLDGAGVGLMFSATDKHGERFVLLTDACAFVFQHPELESTLDRRCRVVGLASSHALFSLTPLQLLARLKVLEVEAFIRERWNAYWDARAPGTPSSRRERANKLYREHFEATVQHAFAQRTLSAEQLKPLWALMEATATTVRLDNQPVHSERLELVLSDKSRVKLPAIWVISVGDTAPVEQLLYLPYRSVAFQTFATRGDMETWLSEQALVPAGLSSTDMVFQYTRRALPLSAGMGDLLDLQQMAQLAALRNGCAQKTGLAEQGARAMVYVDTLDRQRSDSPVFAAPPGLEPVEGDEQALFGSLFPDIPWAQRQAATHAQRDSLETLQKESGNHNDLQTLKALQKTLEAAEDAAEKAASNLLNQDRSQDAVSWNREFTALHKAHKNGLHAEAGVRVALKQLSDEESSLLKALLDTPGDPGADRVAASLTVSLTAQDGQPSSVNIQELNGPFVVTHADVLEDVSSPHAVLLYWPGIGGGLQRFTNRRALELQLLKIGETDNQRALQLKKISGDPLHYALNQLNIEYERLAAAIRQRTAGTDQQHPQDEQLATLRERTLATLQVPVHAARSLVLVHELEQSRSSALAIHRPGWLAKLPSTERTDLKHLVQAYIGAMLRSHALMTILLEPRNDFTRRHLQARLRKDFNILGHFDVQLTLPDSVTWEKRYSVTPTGKVETPVMVPSAQFSKMSLEDLAQFNIDNVHSVQQDALSQRLVFMRLEVTAAVAQDRIKLLNGINLTYLRKTLPELDLPKAYEQQIHRAFMGTADEPAFVNAHRRECLIEPWCLMLKLQGKFACLQKQISLDELDILNIAINADTPEAWRAGGKHVAILPVHLTAGGKDTPNEGGVTLSGVTFIQDQVSAVTLLYTPDSPDDRFLRRYDNLEAARKGLFNLCAQDSMISYVAGRALQGDFRAHISRIRAAQGKHFDAIIGVGPRWPTHTSLAAHLLNAHKGRLIEAHRGTSRSNDALYYERYAVQGPRAFAYIKMAVGLLPIIGTAVALYDAWTAANQASAAFLRGDVGDGVAELGSVLLSLIDAAMDLLPGEAIASAVGSGARTLTRARQLRALSASAAALHAPSMRQARHVVARFAGYEYEKPLSLAGLQAATHGVYRNVYRHTAGNFIVRQGRVFQVEWSSDSRNWRLTGNSRKTYKQPIALDETGQWDTWFGVYGTTFEGGGLGGGNVLGHMADVLDPIWPAAIRERLPRWWVDQAHRRHRALTDAVNDLGGQVSLQMKSTDTALQAYLAADPNHRESLSQVTDCACIREIELSKRHLQTASELLPLTSGNKQNELKTIQSNGAFNIAGRFSVRVDIAYHRLIHILNRIDALTADIDDLLRSELAIRLTLLEDIRKLRLESVKCYDSIEPLMRDFDEWYQRIRVKADKNLLTEKLKHLQKKFSEANVLYLRTGNLLETFTRYDTSSDVSWFILQSRARPIRNEVDHAMFTQYSLPEVTATKDQRNQILRDCIEKYDQFRRAMNAWTASYPQHFHLDAVPLLLDGIEKMRERARKALDTTAQRTPVDDIIKRVFTTENDQLLIGQELAGSNAQHPRYALTSGDGYREIWEPATNGRYRLQNPRQQPVAPTGRNVEPLVTEARQKLNAQENYHTRVQSYAAQGMLPVDLEDMMLREANELIRRADNIAALSPQNIIIAQLRDKANELIATGRAMRTRQALQTKKPTDGMLDDLIAQGAVEVRKTSPITKLNKHRNRRPDHMQEYEIWNLTTAPPKVLWYAHFHYSKAAPRFSEFEKAHLKLPEHRFLTHADNADLPYADIGKRSAVLPHFENL